MTMDDAFAKNLRGKLKSEPPNKKAETSKQSADKGSKGKGKASDSDAYDSDATEKPATSATDDEMEIDEETAEDDEDERWLRTHPRYRRLVELGLRNIEVKFFLANASTFEGKPEDYIPTASDIRLALKRDYDIDDQGDAEISDKPGWHTSVEKSPGTMLRMDEDEIRYPQAVLHGGIRSPEGYMWGAVPEDIVHIQHVSEELQRTSVSALLAWGNAPPVWYRPGIHFCLRGDKDGNTTHLVELSPELSSDLGHKYGALVDESAIKEICGEPELVYEQAYSPKDDPTITGVDMLDVRIALDNLPLDLDIYDPDGILTPGKFAVTDDSDIEHGPNFDRRGRVAPLAVPEDHKPYRFHLTDPTGKSPKPREEWQSTAPATLFLSKMRRIGRGHSALVYEGQLDLGADPRPERLPQSAAFWHAKAADGTPLRAWQFPRRLRVVVKVEADLDGEGHNFVDNEAQAYNDFPDVFSQEWTGFQVIPGMHLPYRISKITPNFYGYYRPAGDGDGSPRPKLLSLMLLEDCGDPIDPAKLSQHHKMEILSMWVRMHNAGFVQGSCFTRNIVAQPGPPSRRHPLARTPRWARRSDTPSFRIIDFGRCERLENKDIFPCVSLETREDEKAAGRQEWGYAHLALMMEYARPYGIRRRFRWPSTTGYGMSPNVWHWSDKEEDGI